MPLNILAISLKTFVASAVLLKYKFAVNLGSSPPSPSETKSSQYFAISKREYLSIKDVSTKSPIP